MEGLIDLSNQPGGLSLNEINNGTKLRRAGKPSGLIGRSEQITRIKREIQVVAPRDVTVIITGESGTGKELVAREIHRLSKRAAMPFVAINCGAIPDQLIESELFGHEKGAFTSAFNRRIGLIESADGGTLFLDEVGELSATAQVKLLRFLQEREILRIGNNKPIRVNTRVIAASNRDLGKLASQGGFRHDLLYRLNVVNLSMPALRDRIEDLELLIQNSLLAISPSYGGRRIHFNQEALELLKIYPWPGNVRELENLLEGLLALATYEEIRPAQLPRKITSAAKAARLTDANCGLSIEVETTQDSALRLANRNFEREVIQRALEKSGYVKVVAAKELGITRRVLKYKMDKLGGF